MKKRMTDPDYRRIRRGRFHPFNFELTSDQREMLQALATMRAISNGATLRQLIMSAYKMQLEYHPTCSSGQDCYMPHLHPVKVTHTTELGDPE